MNNIKIFLMNLLSFFLFTFTIITGGLGFYYIASVALFYLGGWAIIISIWLIVAIVVSIPSETF